MPRLVIGNRNYSSWSLRPWLLMRHFGMAFDTERLPLDTPEFHQRIVTLSPSKRVPVLHDGEHVVWDSLAICEYVNEAYLDGRGWPADLHQRAQARCAAAEMHSGFPALRSQLPMNCRRQPDAYRWKADADADIARVQTLWGELLERSGGPFLCGDFGIVDAMFAPVAVRFRGYGVAMDTRSQAYSEAIFALPAMREWQAEAESEIETMAYDAL